MDVAGGPDEPDELWVAHPPTLPPAPELGPVRAVQGPRPEVSRRLGYICLGLLAVGVVLVLVNVMIPLIPLALFAAPIFYLYLSARRTYVAVGEGWWFTRAEAWGSGKWSTFEALTTVRLRAGANRVPYVELRSPSARGRFGALMSGPVAIELARQTLASGADVDPDAATVLEEWLLS
jgi:hypothetical protein